MANLPSVRALTRLLKMSLGSRTTSGQAQAVLTLSGNSCVDPTIPKRSSWAMALTSSQQNCRVSSVVLLAGIIQRVSSLKASGTTAPAAAPAWPGFGGSGGLAALGSGLAAVGLAAPLGSATGAAGAPARDSAGVRMRKYLVGGITRRSGGRSMRWRFTGGGSDTSVVRRAASSRSRSAAAATMAALAAAGMWSQMRLSVSSMAASHEMMWKLDSSSVFFIRVYRRR